MISFHHGESVSSWMQTVEMPSFAPLLEDISVDVCIVGGGLAGLSTAYMLAAAGRRVCVLEGFEIGSGQTGRTTAHFTYALDERYYQMEKIHGDKTTELVAQSHLAAMKKVVEIIKKEKIDCDLEKINGYLFCNDEDISAKKHEVLNQELEAIIRAGLLDVYLTERVPLDPYDPGPALCFPDQLQLHPLKYLKELARLIIEKGGQIYCNSHVVSVKGGKKAQVTLQNDHVVHCESIVVATNTPINDLVAIHTKQASYRSYVVGFEVPRASIIKGLYWDTAQPYHYIRLEKNENGLSDKEILLVGGQDHKTGQHANPEDCYRKLETWAKNRFPRLGRAMYRWSGHVIEPFDRLAFIGHNPLDSENVYVITGHSGNGMTYCTLGGMLISDLILGKSNPWENVYSPSRISISSAKTYIKENANVIAQYKDWFVEPHFEDLEDDFDNGEGIIYRDGMQIVAAYKDYQGNLELHSAVCTHLGGIVHWNRAEKTWDCPCHGSSYDCHGKVIKGPANMDLAPIERPAVPPPDTVKVWETPDATPVM